MKKKIIYFDMDGVLANYEGKVNYKDKPEIEPNGFFTDLDPIEGAVEAFKKLSEHYDCYILTTAPWSNPIAMSEKRLWVEKHLGELAFKRLMTSHRKDLHIGDYLIDDRTVNGAGEFKGEHIHFGSEKFPNWKAVVNYLLPEKKYTREQMYSFAEHCMIKLATTLGVGSFDEISVTSLHKIKTILNELKNGKKEDSNI